MLLGTNSAICRLRLCSASACILSAAQWAGLKSEIHRPLLGHILNLSPGTGRRLNLSADAATLSSLYLMLERLTVEAPVAPERLAAWASERLSAGSP